MANADTVAFNIAAFIAALFLLEAGADKFIDHTAIVAQRVNVSQTVIGLLTAGAEWEELVVVVASLVRNRSSLALGNVVGSAISNILGAFSIGLIAHERGVDFDQSSKIYSSSLLVITTFVTPFAYFPKQKLWLASGYVLIVLFVLYMVSAAWVISRGTITAPEGSDSDSDSDSESSSIGPSSHSGPTENSGESHSTITGETFVETDPLLTATTDATYVASRTEKRQHKSHTLTYHVSFLILGFFTICLAGYILSHAATTITDQLGLSDVLFGVVILSVATTLPEKFIAVLSGSRGHNGILVANTVGSNIFLLKLCMGIIMVQTGGELDGETVKISELGIMWVSTLAFTLTVMFGGKWSRVIGWMMLGVYVAFIVLEFTVIHRL